MSSSRFSRNSGLSFVSFDALRDIEQLESDYVGWYTSETYQSIPQRWECCYEETELQAQLGKVKRELGEFDASYVNCWLIFKVFFWLFWFFLKDLSTKRLWVAYQDAFTLLVQSYTANDSKTVPNEETFKQNISVLPESWQQKLEQARKSIFLEQRVREINMQSSSSQASVLSLFSPQSMNQAFSKEEMAKALFYLIGLMGQPEIKLAELKDDKAAVLEGELARLSPKDFLAIAFQFSSLNDFNEPLFNCNPPRNNRIGKALNELYSHYPYSLFPGEAKVTNTNNDQKNHICNQNNGIEQLFSELKTTPCKNLAEFIANNKLLGEASIPFWQFGKERKIARERAKKEIAKIKELRNYYGLFLHGFFITSPLTNISFENVKEVLSKIINSLQSSLGFFQKYDKHHAIVSQHDIKKVEDAIVFCQTLLERFKFLYDELLVDKRCLAVEMKLDKFIMLLDKNLFESIEDTKPFKEGKNSYKKLQQVVEQAKALKSKLDPIRYARYFAECCGFYGLDYKEATIEGLEQIAIDTKNELTDSHDLLCGRRAYQKFHNNNTVMSSTIIPTIDPTVAETMRFEERVRTNLAKFKNASLPQMKALVAGDKEALRKYNSGVAGLNNVKKALARMDTQRLSLPQSIDINDRHFAWCLEDGLCHNLASLFDSAAIDEKYELTPITVAMVNSLVRKLALVIHPDKVGTLLDGIDFGGVNIRERPYYDKIVRRLTKFNGMRLLNEIKSNLLIQLTKYEQQFGEKFLINKHTRVVFLYWLKRTREGDNLCLKKRVEEYAKLCVEIEEQNEATAKQNEATAKQNEATAKQNEVIAKQNEVIAKQNEAFAKQNEVIAKLEAELKKEREKHDSAPKEEKAASNLQNNNATFFAASSASSSTSAPLAQAVTSNNASTTNVGFETKESKEVKAENEPSKDGGAPNPETASTNNRSRS